MLDKPEFRHRVHKDRMDAQVLIILAVMMCGGSDQMKARCLYDVLQDDLQTTISAGDEDFPAVFRHMVVLSCYLMPEYYRDELDQPYVTGSVFPELNSREFEETLEEF